MNDPKRPFHAASSYNAFGDPPFLSGLPREEEDFETKRTARAWLRSKGGGEISHCLRGKYWGVIESVMPAEDAPSHEGAAFAAG